MPQKLLCHKKNSANWDTEKTLLLYAKATGMFTGGYVCGARALKAEDLGVIFDSTEIVIP